MEMIWSGFSSSANASASASTSRPSASVLLISTVSPLREVRMSPGRNALPDTAFSTAGISTRSCTCRPVAMIICAKPSTAAAPPMSFFIKPMEAPGLRFSPPVSKHTPLPTSVSRGPVSPHRRSISRGARSAARPTVWIIGKFCSRRASPVITSMLAPCAAASAAAAASRSGGPMSEAGVLIRSRVSASPAASASTCGASIPAGATKVAWSADCLR